MKKLITTLIVVALTTMVYARSAGIRDAIKITNYTDSIVTVTVTMANPIKAQRSRKPVVTKEYILNPHETKEDEGPDFGTYPNVEVTGGTYIWDDQDLIISVGEDSGMKDSFLLSVFEFDGWYYLTFEDHSRIKTRDTALIKKYLGE